MAKNTVFRVYDDEEKMLKVYGRRLLTADKKFDKGKSEKEQFVDRYDQKTEDDQVTEDGHIVSVTTGTGIIDTMYSSMTAVDVEFIVNQIGHGTEGQALVLGRALNQAWKDSKGQKRSRYAVKDSLLVDIGVMKVYYDYVEDVEQRDVPAEALAAQIEDYAAEHDMTKEEAAKAVPAIEDVQIVLRDRVCFDYVDWCDVRFDPSAKRIEDVRWVAQYTQLPPEEVEHNPTWREAVIARYGKTKGKEMLESLEADSTVSTGIEVDASLLKDFKDEEYDAQRITVVEMWDFETGLVTIFPKGNQELVLHQRVNPLMFNLDLEDRNPFKALIVRETPSKLEGNGDMRVIWPALEELDEYRSDQATYFARTIPKFFGPGQALTDDGKKAFKSPVWGEYVGLEEGYSKDQIGEVHIPPFPEQAYDIQGQIQMEMKEATGASEPMRGVFTSKRQTAAETKIVTGAGEQRQAERRTALEDWYVSMARAATQLMQLFYDQERMTRYTDPMGQEFEWKWTKEDIALDADLEISITPKESLTRDARVQRMYSWLNLVLPVPETDRFGALRMMGRAMGFRDEEIRETIKSPEEMQAEQQQQQVAQQLSVSPQQSGGAPPGLSIGSGGG